MKEVKIYCVWGRAPVQVHFGQIFRYVPLHQIFLFFIFAEKDKEVLKK